MVLDGYKTYIVALLLGLLAAARYLEYVDQNAYETLMALLTGGGLAFLRHGMKK